MSITLLDGTTCAGLHDVVCHDMSDDSPRDSRGPQSVSPTLAGQGGIDDAPEGSEQVGHEEDKDCVSARINEVAASPKSPLRPIADASDMADMAAYDTLPVAEEDVLSDLGLQRPFCPRHDLHDHVQECNGVCMPKERTVHYTKKDLEHRGLYRPWFHSRFAKGWINIPRQDAMSDIRAITGSSRERNKQIAAKEREDRERRREEEKKYRTARKGSSKRDETSDESGTEEHETWVGCDSCGKWRRVPRGVDIDTDASFVCTMLAQVSCSTPEDDYDDKQVSEAEEVLSDASDSSSQCSGTKRKASRLPVVREKKVKRVVDDLDDELCLGDLSAMASSLCQGNGAPTMSRLSAVIRVLAVTGKPLHYDLLTRQALVLGLIKFTGSQGTAGESMKAFLNKTIRENKTAAIVNLGKGVYGLKEWIANGQLSLPSSPASGNASPTKVKSKVHA
mmetsp:Transcript_24264/g.47083  ORF Transcript_24264/g.47083 Transcript_24264/m.47083 type:complete len:449 (+) Transcript_24264:381-1727(+)